MDKDFQEIDVQKVRQILEKGQATIVDVRDAAAYQQAHIENAVLVNEENINSFLEQVDKNKPLICYCYHGFSSQSAAGFFKSKGFSDVYSMRGGFEEWRKVFMES